MPAAGTGTLEDRRAGYDGLLAGFQPRPGVEVESFRAAGVQGYWVDATGRTADRGAVMLHGGGYMIGSARGYLPFAGYVSRVTGARVLVPDYRLAPEHPYPAEIEDALVAVETAIETVGADSTFLIGDSAGGGLTLSTLHAAEELGRESRAALVLVSALVDLRVVTAATRNAPSRTRSSRAGASVVPPRCISADADGERPPGPSRWNVTSRRCRRRSSWWASAVLLDDARHLVAKRERDGAVHAYAEYFEMVHVWPLFASFLS